MPALTGIPTTFPGMDNGHQPVTVRVPAVVKPFVTLGRRIVNCPQPFLIGRDPVYGQSGNRKKWWLGEVASVVMSKELHVHSILVG